MKKTRVKVDLPWIHSNSVNSNVLGDILDSMNFKLKYPTIDHLFEQISWVGNKTLLYKIDLQGAFRNLRVDPFDYPALGLTWRGHV